MKKKNIRDKIAYALWMWVMNHIASKSYRNDVMTVVSVGMKIVEAARKDHEE